MTVTRDKLKNPRLRTSIDLKMQIRQITDVVVRLNDAKQSMRTQRRAYTAQEAANAANAVKDQEARRVVKTVSVTLTRGHGTKN